ncbi:redox-sensing transcriptional repressor Rex [Thermoanaerobacterium sp. DL9XJH110]|uniref:redox-sensing transcriptional repressor Rex n=1 Tax=Thermoanaerobacterium sp. DL9XJH110 TaxID=3386643 RepID=UPI003BB7889C
MESDDIKKVSMAVIKRLPKYHQCLGNLLKDGVERISSQELSQILGFTASQIRQDLNNFGEFGQQGYGYNVEQLYNEIAKILGLNYPHRMVIIGAGNLGQALANYEDFEAHGFKIIALFDVNPRLVGLKIRGIPILDAAEMDYYINRNEVDIAIITVPQDRAQEVADILARTAVKGIWNFSPAKLVVPKNIVVENVHLIESLFTLSYRMNEEKLQERILKQKMKKLQNR